jgi:Domain of unknown function (DUF4157)
MAEFASRVRATTVTNDSVAGLQLHRKCACGGSTRASTSCAECEQKKLVGTPLQPKLRINEPGDRYEQEADRIADGIMGSAHHSPTQAVSPQLQRLGADQAGSVAAPAIVGNVLSAPGQPLDAATRAFFEPRFGHDFGRVRVHAGGMAEQSARDVNAVAYTVGHDVVFGAGRFAPGTHEGRRLIAHELSHVVQQSRVHGMTSGLVQRQPANKTEAYYQRLVKQKKWCRDSEDTGALHPGQQCYREIPVPVGYPSGDQVCFDKATGKFVEPPSPDIYSPVWGQKADGTCDIAMKAELLKFWTLRSRRALGHGGADVLTEDVHKFGLWYGRISGIAMGIALPKGVDSDLAAWAVPSILGYLGGKLGERALPRLTGLAEKHGFLPTVTLGFGSNIGLGLGLGLEKRDRPLPLVPINTYLTFDLDSTLALGGEAGENYTFLAKIGVRVDPGKQGGVFALSSVGAGLALGKDVSGAASVEVGAGLRATDFLDVQLVRETVVGGGQGGDTYWLEVKLAAPQRVLERHKKASVVKQRRSPTKTGP